MAFIRENLTLRLVQENWPKVPLHDLNFGNTDKNEKQNYITMNASQFLTRLLLSEKRKGIGQIETCSGNL
jgi:hypothetical protein